MLTLRFLKICPKYLVISAHVHCKYSHVREGEVVKASDCNARELRGGTLTFPHVLAQFTEDHIYNSV